LKCSDTFSTEGEFYWHVRYSHILTPEVFARIITYSYEATDACQVTEIWCPECSATFASKSGLAMHVAGYHEFVGDVKIYMEEVGYDCEIPLHINQCDICLERFGEIGDDDKEEEARKILENHHKVHGMSFLRRRELWSKIKSFNQ